MSVSYPPAKNDKTMNGHAKLTGWQRKADLALSTIDAKTKARERARLWHYNHLEKSRATKKAYYHMKRKDPEWVKHNNERTRLAQRKVRLQVIYGYGGICVCCGETRIEFLALDHINGGGRQHRAAIKGAYYSYWNWYIKHKFPEGFRVLCHNCNQSLGCYGYCPHKGVADVR